MASGEVKLKIENYDTALKCCNYLEEILKIILMVE